MKNIFERGRTSLVSYTSYCVSRKSKIEKKCFFKQLGQHLPSPNLLWLLSRTFWVKNDDSMSHLSNFYKIKTKQHINSRSLASLLILFFRVCAQLLRRPPSAVLWPPSWSPDRRCVARSPILHHLNSCPQKHRGRHWNQASITSDGWVTRQWQLCHPIRSSRYKFRCTLGGLKLKTTKWNYYCSKLYKYNLLSALNVMKQTLY